MSLGLQLCRACCAIRRSIRPETRRSAAAASMVNKLASSIQLSATEQELFTLLKQVLVTEGLADTELRCAGGWVRDKLLGKDSHDIDIALNNLYGEQFATHVNNHLQASSGKINKVAVIKSNPDQSKHLQTARMKVVDLELDLVNLRSDTYTDSRIPEIGIGTPEQDALRRDLTINSLFYNINTEQVEDWTNHGLEDLQEGIIRTPLPAEQTFLDDPLRVLRAVRFGARFDFKLDAQLEEAAASPQVRTALGQKVSKERIGQELRSMLLGQNPARAVRDIERLRLFTCVFQLPSAVADPLGDAYGSPCLAVFQAFYALLQRHEPAREEREQLPPVLIAALLLPLRSLTAKVKKRQDPAPAWLVRESIKWNNAEATAVAELHTQAPELAAVHQQLQAPELNGCTAEASDAVRVSLGHAVRALGKLGLWRSGIMLASLLRMPEAQLLGEQPGSSAASSPGPSEAGQKLEQQLEMCRALEAAVVAFGLQGCWDWKPLLNGNQIAEELGPAAKGPPMKLATGKLADWHLAHPQASQEEALRWLRAQGQSLLQ